MKRVLDFIKALGAFQGKRYDHSYIGRVSIAFWGEEDASCTFSCQNPIWNIFKNQCILWSGIDHLCCMQINIRFRLTSWNFIGRADIIKCIQNAIGS